jgi:hypothetical protein
MRVTICADDDSDALVLEDTDTTGPTRSLAVFRQPYDQRFRDQRLIMHFQLLQMHTTTDPVSFR